MRGTQRGRTLSRSMRAAALAVFGIGAHGPAAHADPPGQAAAPRSAASQGVTMIAVTTSAAQPDSKVMLQSLRVHPWLVANAQRIKLVEIAGETQANSAARVGLSVYPSVIAYSQGANGVEVIGGRSGFGSANDAVEWLRSLEQRTVDSRRAVSDPNVALTMLDKCPPYASQQGYAPPASVPQAPLTPASVPPLPTTPASTPMMYTPVTSTTASVVQAPAQNFVIQQQPGAGLFCPTGRGDDLRSPERRTGAHGAQQSLHAGSSAPVIDAREHGTGVGADDHGAGISPDGHGAGFGSDGDRPRRDGTDSEPAGWPYDPVRFGSGLAHFEPRTRPRARASCSDGLAVGRTIDLAWPHAHSDSPGDSTGDADDTDAARPVHDSIVDLGDSNHAATAPDIYAGERPASPASRATAAVSCAESPKPEQTLLVRELGPRRVARATA